MDIDATMPGAAAYDTLPEATRRSVSKEEMYRLMFNAPNDHARWDILIQQLSRKTSNPGRAQKAMQAYYKEHRRNSQRHRQNEDLLPLCVNLDDLPDTKAMITDYHPSNEVRWAFLGGSLRPGGNSRSAGRQLRARVEARQVPPAAARAPSGLSESDLLEPLPAHLHKSFTDNWRFFGGHQRGGGWLALDTALFRTFNEFRKCKGDLELRRIMYVKAADDTRKAVAQYRAKGITFY